MDGLGNYFERFYVWWFADMALVIVADLDLFYLLLLYFVSVFNYHTLLCCLMRTLFYPWNLFSLFIQPFKRKTIYKCVQL